MRPWPLVLALALAACGRPLTPNETAFSFAMHGDSFDPAPVRLHDSLAVGAGVLRPPGPYLTCRERLFPRRKVDRVLHPGAMAIFQDVFFRPDLYAPDYLEGWPDRINLSDAMLFAHEMTHVWQWQNRAVTGYHPLRAAFEHVGSPDPYLFDPDTVTAFTDYGFEQQGAIVEEYICCAALAPDADRTARLRDMLAAHFPVARLEAAFPGEVILPWSGVETAGICDGPPRD